MRMLLTLILILCMLAPISHAAADEGPVLTAPDEIRAMLGALPRELTSKDMEERGFCIWVHGVFQPGSRERLEGFLASAQSGEPCDIHIASYTDEGDQILQYVSYDGSRYHYASDWTRDQYGGEGARISTADYRQSVQFDTAWGREIALTNLESPTYGQLHADENEQASVILLLDYSESVTRGLFDYKLLPSLYKEHGQFAYSPMSLEIALAMATEGAAGETRKQMLSFMEADRLLEHDFARYSEVKMANAAIVSGETTLLDSYQQLLRDKYLAQLLSMDADVVGQVNAWANEHTGGMIPEFLSEQPSDGLRLMLLNALALDAKWSAPFDPANTWDGVFHTPDGDVSVSFMRQTSSFQYAKGGGAQAVKLPYEGASLEMLVILPEEDSMERALEQLGKGGTRWLGEFRYVDEVNIRLPRLSIQSEHTLKEVLEAHGLTLPFVLAADFSRMTGNRDLYIGDVLQKVRLDIDEDGTRAAAVTVVEMLDGAAPPSDMVEMIVDRPYILLLQDDSLGTTLFAAVVTDPTKD